MRIVTWASPAIFGALLVASGLAQSNEDFKKVENKFFSFSVPSSFKKTKQHGIDSFVEEYVAQDMAISFDYGPYSNNFEDWPKETKFEQLKVNGKAARIGTVVGDFLHKGFPYSTQIRIGLDHGDALSMYVACKSRNDMAVARKIFESIEFKEQKTP